MTTFAFAAFVLASLFLFIHIMNTPLKKKEEDMDEEERDRMERLRNIERHGNIQLDDSMDEHARFIVA